MAFVYAYFFSDFLSFEMSLLLLTVSLRGVSNKHCLLYFSLSLNLIGLQTQTRFKEQSDQGFTAILS